jgi:hypothetical protein
MGFSVYSLADVITTFNHPDVGRSVLSDVGAGRITISYAGDMGSATVTATGYVVMNKLVAKNGSISLEIPQNSDADKFLRKWIQYIKGAPTKKFALATLTLNDSAAGRILTMTGVIPQKEPDEGYDQQSGNRQYNLLYAELMVK